MPIAPLPMVGFYNKQRFPQFDPSDTAGWYLVASETGKKKAAMYPTLGRRHIVSAGQNKLFFPAEPRLICKSINFWYACVGSKIFRIDRFFNEIEITQGKVTTLASKMYFTFIATGLATNTIPPTINAVSPTYACFTDGQHIYVYNENNNAFIVVTDTNAPPKPLCIATFGNRIVVSSADTSQFGLSEINLVGLAETGDKSFTIAGLAVFAQASSIIKQMGVFLNTLYIFCDYVTSPWQNIPSTFIAAGGDQTNFPWKNNSTYNYPYGIANSDTLSIDSNIMAWVAQNSEGLIQPMISMGAQPVPISTQAVDTLLQRILNFSESTPLAGMLNARGFLYSYENILFYRLVVGNYFETELVDFITDSISFEYNFSVKEWHRCIEANGGRNRIQQHVYFGGRHLVTVQKDSTVYQMGAYYTNDITNPVQTNPQLPNAYLTLPMRYERVSPMISEDDYMEFVTEYVEIDFVFGETRLHRQDGNYANTKFIIAEAPASDGQPQYIIDEKMSVDGASPVFLIDEAGNFPQMNEGIYYNYYKPIVELLFSDDGGISFQSADVREFSQIGQYRWRMRWYELGTSRDRCYKLVCVSPVPVVILGAVQQKRRCNDAA